MRKLEVPRGRPQRAFTPPQKTGLRAAERVKVVKQRGLPPTKLPPKNSFLKSAT